MRVRPGPDVVRECALLAMYKKSSLLMTRAMAMAARPRINLGALLPDAGDDLAALSHAHCLQDVLELLDQSPGRHVLEIANVDRREDGLADRAKKLDIRPWQVRLVARECLLNFVNAPGAEVSRGHVM